MGSATVPVAVFGVAPEACPTERGLSQSAARRRQINLKLVPNVSRHFTRCELGQLALRPEFPAPSGAASSLRIPGDVAPERSQVHLCCRIYKYSSPTDFAAFASFARQKFNALCPFAHPKLLLATAAVAGSCTVRFFVQTIHWRDTPFCPAGNFTGQ